MNPNINIYEDPEGGGWVCEVRLNPRGAAREVVPRRCVQTEAAAETAANRVCPTDS